MLYTYLRAFHAVATQGGFSRAAAALHVTQPTISDQVKALENLYGVQLFERRGRRVAVTELGRELLAVTRQQFSLEAEAEQLLLSAKGLAYGRLRVGADAPFLVIPVLGSFKRRHPGIQLSVTFGNTEQVLERLFERDCDVAVLPEIGTDERLYSVPFKRDRLVAFVDRGHAWVRRRRLRLEDLADQRLVLREAGSTTRMIFERVMTEAGVTLRRDPRDRQSRSRARSGGRGAWNRCRLRDRVWVGPPAPRARAFTPRSASGGVCGLHKGAPAGAGGGRLLRRFA